MAAFGTPWAPKVLAQPADRLMLAGNATGFTVEVDAFPAPSIRWQIRGTPGGSFSDIEGNASALTSVLSLPGVASGQDGEAYRAVITNSEGTITTTPAILSVVASGTELLEDPDGIGACRLVAFAFGLDPVSPDRSRLPAATTVDGRCQLAFTRLKSHPDVSYVVEASENLLDWEPADSQFEMLGVTVVNEALERVVLRETGVAANAAHRWFRIRIIHLQAHPESLQ